MPLYCYKCESCGNVDEDVREIEARNEPMGCTRAAPGTPDHCPGLMYRDRPSELVNSGDQQWQKPVHSDAMGMHPDQVPEFKRQNPDIDVDREGRPILRSHAEQKRVMKRLGFHNKDGYD